MYMNNILDFSKDENTPILSHTVPAIFLFNI